MLRVEGLTAGYGKLVVLDDVNVLARGGRITVVVGPNGSGKSTLLKTIFGLTRIYSGVVRLDGEVLSGLPPHEIARRGVAYVPQVENVFAELTVEENLRIASYGMEESVVRDGLDLVLSFFPVLRERMRQKARTMSGGERRMLAIAMALLRRPRLMMFDEPTSDLSPLLARQVLDKIVELRDRIGLTIVLVEQNARKALEIGDDAYLLVSGRVVFGGGADELLSHPELGRMYLGVR